MIKKTVLLLLMIVLYAEGQECYRAYHYNDKHVIKTIMNQKLSKESPAIEVELHVRNVEHNNTNYTLFWFENGVTDKALINKESIYAPFLVKRSRNKDEFQIQALQSLSKDRTLQERLIGMVETLQYKAEEGKYRFRSAAGTVEVTQKNSNGQYIIKRLKAFQMNTQAYNTKYLYSETNITVDHNCSIWSGVSAEDKIKFHVELMDVTVVDRREFSLLKSDRELPKDHWFFKLSTNILSWGFGKKKNLLSLDDALKSFDRYQQEMHTLLNDRKKFGEWVLQHMDFLAYLSNILKYKALDDDVSRTLFAKLGYIDTAASSRILAQVLLDTDLNERDRFRSLMGLKNTSAPLDDDLMSDILEYGFSSNTNDMIQKATGMLIGTLARERYDRVPEQYEQLSEAIADAIQKPGNKTVALNAAGNMLQTASEEVIETVDDVLVNDPDTLNRKKSAEALSRIGKSSLEAESFQKLIENEENSNTAAQLIRASSTAKNFKSNNKFKQHLVSIAVNRAKVLSNRLAALETLDKADFGKTPANKKKIRKMMLNEKNADVLKMLKELYREPIENGSL